MTKQTDKENDAAKLLARIVADTESDDEQLRALAEAIAEELKLPAAGRASRGRILRRRVHPGQR